MNVQHTMARATAALALGLVMAAPASAQSAHRFDLQPLSFNRSGQTGMWHTVLLVSAAVAIVGVVQQDSTLILLGVAGVGLSLYESGGMSFQFRPRGLDLAGVGPLSFGVTPLSQQG
jgi:hypothetical protein